MFPNARKRATKALVQIGGIGGRSRSRAAAASQAAYRQSKQGGIKVSHLSSGGKVGTPSRTGGMTAKQRLAMARGQNVRNARVAANAARDAEFLQTGKRRAIAGSGIIGVGALTANPKSNEYRTASFGTRRPMGGGIPSPRGSGRYA